MHADDEAGTAAPPTGRFDGESVVVSGTAAIASLHGWSRGGFGELELLPGSTSAACELRLNLFEAYHLACDLRPPRLCVADARAGDGGCDAPAPVRCSHFGASASGGASARSLSQEDLAAGPLGSPSPSRAFATSPQSPLSPAPPRHSIAPTDDEDDLAMF